MLAFAWIGVRNTATLLAFAVLYGFFAGAATTVTAPIDALLCPGVEEMGVRMGMLLLPWALGLLVGTPIASAFLSQSGGSLHWLGLQLFTGIVLLVALAFCIATKSAKNRKARQEIFT